MSKSSRAFVSPAKINLFLRILSKRADGYHELASLFQAIDLHDTLFFSFASQDEITCSDKGLCLDASNTVVRALALFRQKTGHKFSISIHLDKRIPSESGLGGASSNCATTLWALNQLCGTQIPSATLAAWSGEISADAPFFFSTGTAYCCGIGEKIEQVAPLASLRGQTISLFKPEEGLSTAKIFSTLTLDHLSSISPEKLLHSFVLGVPQFVNDLEVVAGQLCPKLKILKERLPSPSFMTGSGTTFCYLGEVSDPVLGIEPIQTLSLNRSPDTWWQAKG